MKLTLDDLTPVESNFELSNGKTYTLKRFSLRAQAWCKTRFGEAIHSIFEKQQVLEMAEIAHFLLKSKAEMERDGTPPHARQGYRDEFASFEDFAEQIVSMRDRISLIEALLATIGISQPIIAQLHKEELAKSKKAPLPKRKS